MPGYETKQENVDISGVQQLIIQSLLDRQQYADPDGEAEALGISSAAWPLFGLLWPSGQELAAWMALRVDVPNERILEVGCGLALASLMLHRRGVDVTASDCHPLTARFLHANAALNAMLPITYRHGHWAAAADAPVHTDRPVVEGRFDLIIGSDVLYERDDSGHLSGFIARHALPCAEVLIVDPNRSNRAGFNRRMAVEGFTLEEIDLSRIAIEGVDAEGQANGSGRAAYRGRMLRYRRG